ncbi:glucose-methanol-choline oxidoreductase family protein [Synechococcus sp. BIOS-E4-1]|uniref:GMC oxidoreductase n=1 Tax=Synechococcus sp. BIOS-E4-1 TaxID=1400864 RepID=UPI0016467338|nr:GMC family oxidoreductase [Synechococcus sp. BIOS-E4-1]QNI55664.1 glucose-methanol-choline oxidoreductase family protein [Synechococcus sp. BIOS-E4-1]
MIIDDSHYDIIIIGSGAGGGTLAGYLSREGRSVLLLERGEAVEAGWQKRPRVKDELWFGPDGDPFSPQTFYALGGNTKIWGAVLERMREKDFTDLPLQEGVSPAWPFDYSHLAPYYDQAEAVYRVHGKAGVDPTEPTRSRGFDQSPRPVMPFLEELREGLLRQGCQPYDLPLSWSDNEESPVGDAELCGLATADTGNLEIRYKAKALRLHVSPSGREVKKVEADVNGEIWLFSANLFVLAAGAINTPAILLRSGNERHPRGLSNKSDQVGRNLMNVQITSILQRSAAPNSGLYARSYGVNDYYWGDKNVSFPLGHIQAAGGVLQDALFAESPPVLSLVSKLIPNFGIKRLASRTVAWWAMTEVLPDQENKVWLNKEQIRINYLHNNREAHDRLVYRWIDTLKAVEADPGTKVVTSEPVHPRGEAPLSVVGFACGTCRMGEDPVASVVDATGKCHELDNVYIADSSVFPSCPSVGPGLTTIALALRMADTLHKRLQN